VQSMATLVSKISSLLGRAEVLAKKFLTVSSEGKGRNASDGKESRFHAWRFSFVQRGLDRHFVTSSGKKIRER